MATEREMFLDCEVKRRRIRVGGGYEPFCEGQDHRRGTRRQTTPSSAAKTAAAPSKVVKRRSTEGPALHIEHKLKTDSEHCIAGLHFLKATDGRIARMSSAPRPLRLGQSAMLDLIYECEVRQKRLN